MLQPLFKRLFTPGDSSATCASVLEREQMELSAKDLATRSASHTFRIVCPEGEFVSIPHSTVDLCVDLIAKARDDRARPLLQVLQSHSAPPAPPPALEMGTRDRHKEQSLLATRKKGRPPRRHRSLPHASSRGFAGFLHWASSDSLEKKRWAWVQDPFQKRSTTGYEEDGKSSPAWASFLRSLESF